MDITVNIGGAIQEYIDADDLRSQIASGVQYQIREAVSSMMRDDNALTQSVRVMLAEKIANAVLPQELQDAVSKKIIDAVGEANDSTVLYSWGLYEKGREILQSMHDDIADALKQKIADVTDSVNYSEWDIKSLVYDMLTTAVKEKKIAWNVDKIVTEFVNTNLSDFLEDTVKSE